MGMVSHYNVVDNSSSSTILLSAVSWIKLLSFVSHDVNGGSLSMVHA